MQVKLTQMRFQLALALLVACCLGACASVDAVTTEYVGVPKFPPSDAKKIDIMRSEPAQRIVRLGEIVVDASVDPPPAAADIEDKLRWEAARLGADAVVVVVDQVQQVGAYVSGPYWAPTVQPLAGRKVVGIAVKYQ